MSTKIFNVYKVSRLNLKQLTDYLLVIRRDHQQHCFRVLGEHFPTQSHEEIAKALEVSFRKNWNSILDPLNLQASVVVIPYEGELFVQFFVEDLGDLKRRYPRLFKHLTDFSYQDQTDKPSKVGERAWACRKKVWNKLIEERGDSPQDLGFVFIMVEPDGWRRLAWDYIFQRQVQREVA